MKHHWFPKEYTFPKKYIYGLLILGLLIILLFSCRPPSFNIPNLDKVNAIKVKLTKIPLYQDYIGTTKAISTVSIKARVQGFLEQMLFIEGKHVDKDQLLFVIDERPFIAKLQEAEGVLKKAKANLLFQTVEYYRMKDLVEKGKISQEKFDETTAKYESAQGDLATAEGQVAAAKINLSYCAMRAPFPGRIGKKYVDIGNLVGGKEDTVLANVVQLNPMYVEFYPATSDFATFIQYRKNAPFAVEVTLPEQITPKFHGKINLVNNETNINTSTILMRAEIENPEEILLSGLYVNLRVILANEVEKILIPMNAVVATEEYRSVFVLNQQHKVESRKIVISGQYAQQYIVESGLKPGDVVFTDYLYRLSDGMVVTPKFSS